MKKESLHRVYNMSDGKLLLIANDKLASLNRDFAEFSRNGYDTATVANIQTHRDAFFNFPADDIYDGDRQEATRVKNEAREELTVFTRKIQLAGERALKDTAYNAKFGDTALVSLTDQDFILNCQTVHAAAVLHSTALAAKGVTATDLTAYEAAINDMDNKIRLQLSAKKVRDIAAETRITMGNELYAFISEICAVGKNIWENVSEAHYNDYILYDTPSGTDNASSTETLAAGETKAFFTGQVDATAQVYVTVKSGTGKLAIYGASAPQNPLPINSALVNIAAPLVVVAGTISNAGPIDSIYIHNTSAAPITFAVEILS